MFISVYSLQAAAEVVALCGARGAVIELDTLLP
jgi:hypothetical protein